VIGNKRQRRLDRERCKALGYDTVTPLDKDAAWYRPYLDVDHQRARWTEAYFTTTAMINERSLGLGVELGVWRGWHSDQILLRCPTARVIGVDMYGPATPTFDETDESSAAWGATVMQDMLQLLAPHGDRYKFIHGPTVDASKTIADGSLDWVYVDACHYEQAVYDDLCAWFGKLRGPGTLFMGHDYCGRGCPEVKPAVDRFVAERGLQLHYVPNSVWWVDL